MHARILAARSGRRASTVQVPLLDFDANIRSVPTYRYTVTEYDAHRPWLIVGPLRRMTVELEEGEEFALGRPCVASASVPDRSGRGAVTAVGEPWVASEPACPCN